MARGNLVAKLMAHRDTIYSLCYSRDGTVLASGGADDCVNVWDFKRLIQEADLEEIYSSRNPIIRFVTILLLGTGENIFVKLMEIFSLYQREKERKNERKNE